MMGNSNSMITKYEKEDFKDTSDIFKKQSDQVKKSADYEARTHSFLNFSLF